MSKNGVIVVFLLVFVAGCSIQPQLVRRYRNARWGRTSKDLVSVSAFTLDAPPDKPKDFILQLSPAAQAAFIKQIGQKTKGKSPREFLNLLTAPLPPASSHIAWDKTVFKKRVVFSVEKNSVLRGGKPTVGPADRISQLRIRLVIPLESDAEFASWDKFDTLYNTVDLGRVLRTQSLASGLGMSIASGLTGPSPLSVNPRALETRSFEEEAPLKARYIVLSGRIDPGGHRVELVENGQVGIDLTGTFSVDFLIRVRHALAAEKRVAVIGPFETGNNEPVKPANVRIDFEWIRYKKTAAPIRCRLSYDYTLRHVIGNARELDEGLQSVIYLDGSFPAAGSPPYNIDLVDSRDLLATVYTIALGRVRYGQGRMLALIGDAQKVLYFPTYDSAENFLEWLKAVEALRVAGYRLGITQVVRQYNENGKTLKAYIGPVRLRKEQIDRLIVYPVVLNPDESVLHARACKTTGELAEKLSKN